MPAQNALHQKEFLYDGSVDGLTQGAKVLGSLPKGAVVTDAHVTVETAVTSNGSATVAFGNSTTADQYISAKAKTTVDTVGKVVGGPANALAQNTVANDSVVAITIATADLLTGKLRLTVRFFIPSTSPLTTN